VCLTATRLLAVFLRSISKQRAQPMQLLRPFASWVEKRAAAARRRFKRKNGRFWSAQFCTEVARPKDSIMIL
jgi:hypothetical protein